MRTMITKTAMAGLLALGIAATPAAASVYFKKPLTGSGSFNFTVPPGSYQGFGYVGSVGAHFSVQDNGGGNYTATYTNFQPDTKVHVVFSGGNYSIDGGALAPGVPEPAVWVSLVLGFGGIGAVLRRRKGRAAAAIAS